MSTYPEDHWSRVGLVLLPIREIECAQRARDVDVTRSAINMVADWIEAHGECERGETAADHHARLVAGVRDLARRAAEGYPRLETER